MNIDIAFLAQHVSAFLESPYKPFLMILPFIPWAWLVSSKLDKDAQYFHLNVVLWNGIHLAAGAAVEQLSGTGRDRCRAAASRGRSRAGRCRREWSPRPRRCR